MARPKNSQEWLREHFDDKYVQMAKQDGYRSRASYKLLELCEKDRLIRSGMTVVDLGSAPGGWSQVAAKQVGFQGRVVASDILEMDSVAGVEFIHGDFTDDAVYKALQDCIGSDPVDLVISDMAPNMSGMRDIDIPQVMYLAELALDLARTVLKPEGSFLVKVFHGEGYEELQKQLKSSFTSLKVRKPKASRARSSEIYLLASGFRGLN